MSGHNKWSQIKHRKEAVDKKKGLSFSKYLRAIAMAAKSDPKPETNPRLRSLIEQAQAANVPNENIHRAVSKASEEKELKEITIEAYGPEGVAILIEAITDNSNRTIQQVRTIIGEVGAKVADTGSVLWAFEQTPDRARKAKFPQTVSPETKNQLINITTAIEEHDDVQRIVTTAD